MQAWVLDECHYEIALRLTAALLAIGACIGLERSYHGRPDGFRTHPLVCLSTCLLMLVTVFEPHWFDAAVTGRRMVIRIQGAGNARLLSDALCSLQSVREFRIAPSGD